MPGRSMAFASVVQGVEIWKFKTPTLNYNPASDHFQFALYYLNGRVRRDVLGQQFRTEL